MREESAAAMLLPARISSSMSLKCKKPSHRTITLLPTY
jgi:hypothetical protein